MEADQQPGISIEVPACFAEAAWIDRNRARQLLSPTQTVPISVNDDGVFLTLGDGTNLPIVSTLHQVGQAPRGLKVPSAARRDPASLPEADPIRWIGDLSASEPDQVRDSLADAFQFLQADVEADQPGLRIPQIGALHAVLAHWTTASKKPGTVVMPTGTGKTETMLALFAAQQLERLIVVVPSDVLRTQIAEKFGTYGVLQQAGVIGATAVRPVVGQVRHKFSDAEAAKEFAEACNVIVTTPGALFASEPGVTDAFLATCSHLFVDEAHHVEAPTWRHIRDSFSDKPVVQFTATPYREDGRQIFGRVIYAFPLREAQRQGYFSTIDYLPVVEFDNPDGAIASRAIEVLRADLADGRDHLLMARVRRIGRARDLREVYAEIAPDLEPVLLHSSLNARERSEALEAINSRQSRIIVCVDMLGEGFDLPALKVAAIHDPHKSLGVTLQFVGRFARTADEIGDATVVVGRPEREYDENLRKLYAEDADWNLLIQDLSEEAVGEQEEVSDFETAFGELPEEASLRNLAPKMSTVVYRTTCEAWDPQAIHGLYSEEQLFTPTIAVNAEDRVAWFIAKLETPVRWGDLTTIAEVTYHLYVLYWDDDKQLLYINSSNNASLHEQLAEAVCGDEAERITGEAVYRVMAGVQRLVPVNVGVLDVRNRSRRFSLHVGADVIEGFPTAEAQTKTKTNIFAYGFEEGRRVSLGASLKGRVWSYRIAQTLKHWVDWCDYVGAKLSNDSINIDAVMRDFIRPKSLDSRPELVPLALEWPWQLFLSTTEEVRVARDDQSWPLVDVDLTITRFETEGPLSFTVSTPDWSAEYAATINDGAIEFRADGDELEVVSRHTQTPLSEYFDTNGPLFFFEQDATLWPPALLIQPDRDLPGFDAEKLTVLDWSGIDLSKESQGADRDADSIQAKVISHLLEEDEEWDLVIDDDGSGEIADIVAIRTEDDKLIVKLIHCKYSSGPGPGARVADLYEVCGQAQKSVRWRRNVGLFFRHLIRRERTRQDRHGKSGFQTGTGNDLYQLDEESRLLKPEFHIVIAQPGISKRQVSDAQLDLLGATEVYLHETAYADLDVICSN